MMAVYDDSQKGYRIFIGDLGHYVGRYDVEREFEEYGPIRDVWIARNFLEYKISMVSNVEELLCRNVTLEMTVFDRSSDIRNPPGFAFVVYKYPTDAERAVRQRHGGIVCGRRVRVEHARPFEERLKEMNSRGRLGPRSRSRSRPPRHSRSKRSRSGSKSRRCRRRSRSKPKRRRTKSRSHSRGRHKGRKSKRKLRSRSRSRSRSHSRPRKRRNFAKRSRSSSSSSSSSSSESRSRSRSKEKSRSFRKRSGSSSDGRKFHKTKTKKTDSSRVGKHPNADGANASVENQDTNGKDSKKQDVHLNHAGGKDHVTSLDVDEHSISNDESTTNAKDGLVNGVADENVPEARCNADENKNSSAEND